MLPLFKRETLSQQNVFTIEPGASFFFLEISVHGTRGCVVVRGVLLGRGGKISTCKSREDIHTQTYTHIYIYIHIHELFEKYHHFFKLK